MQYLNKRFSVYMQQQADPSCYICHKTVRVGIASQLGHLCWECYANEKTKRKMEKLKKEIEATENNHIPDTLWPGHK